VPSGVKLMPHRHPEDRIYTVMSRIFYIGLGNQFDGEKVEAYPPGSVTQVTAIGALGLEYVDPSDDPRKQSR
jgi:hypothetical protein